MAFGSFSAGLSGLNANAIYLSVIGNNLANINTVGFKASTVTFADLVSQTIGGTSSNPMQVGLGVFTGSISLDLSQGALENTREATHVAIQGNGFFVVKDGTGYSYTRAGNFGFDSSGRLVTPDGFPVQGYTTLDAATGGIAANGEMSDIVIPPGVLRPPTATTTFQTITNLDAEAEVGDTFTTAVEVYDVLGAAHVVTINYTKTAAGAWSYDATVPGGEVTGGTEGEPFSLGTGAVTFDADGKLQNVNGAAPADVVFTTPAWKSGAAASTLTWDVVAAGAGNTLTGFSSSSATTSKSQNGSPAGTIDNVSIVGDGTIYATFGAGQTVAVGQIAMASFNNPKGLVKAGSNRFQQSQASGLPSIGVAGAGGRGTIIGNALEQSNVDIAQQFTQMILAQRGYQANSKTITVSDEIMLDTLALKR